MSREPPLRELFSLEGRAALVTGAAGGIGSAVVARLVEAGAHVVASDLPGSEVPGAAEVLPCNLVEQDAVEWLLGEVGHHTGRLDVLVHAAGITRDGVLWKMSPEDWRTVLAVNLDSAFELLRHAAPLMRRTGGGSAVLLSSINGERGKFGQANYAASKAGLIGLARTAARELGAFGIRVNCLAPGLIRTPMTAVLDPRFLEEGERETALGRLGNPDDVARAALFLVSPLARHVTGQVLRVDGGQLTA